MGRQHLTSTTTKWTTLKSIELQWVLKQFVSFNLVHYWLFLSSPPSSQASVFRDSWMGWWQNSLLNCLQQVWSYICIYGHQQGCQSNNQGMKTAEFFIYICWLHPHGLQPSLSSSTNIFDNLPALSAPATSELQDDLNRYLNTDPEQVTTVFKWWYKRRRTYPHLHCMALDYLTSPSGYLKWCAWTTLLTLFFIHSYLCCHQTGFQSRLNCSLSPPQSPQSTWSLMCIGIWSLLSYVKDSDIKAAIALPVVPACMKEDDG